MPAPQHVLLIARVTSCSFLADCTACSVISYWHDNVVYLSVSLSVCNTVHCVLAIRPTAKVSERVNMNMILQLSTPTLTLSPQTLHLLNHRVDI